MKLYLVQHGKAKSKEEDAARPLSEDGSIELRKIAAFIKKSAKLKLQKIIHSGKLRAQQTADYIHENALPDAVCEQSEGLTPMDDPAVWRNRLRNQSDDIMLVGHLPHLSRLASLLLVGNPDRPVIHFKNGGVACLEVDETTNWRVCWIIIPAILK